MEIIAFVQYGTPVVLLGLIVSNAWLMFSVNELRDDVHTLKGHITYSDTCNERHKEIDRRISRNEARLNGNGG